MDNYLVSKIKVGISACQYGAKSDMMAKVGI